MSKAENRSMSIGEASRLTGASVRQIRSWAAQGYIPEPERVVCGVRAYRNFHQDDLEVIRKIKELLNQGFTLAYASEKARQKNNKLED